MTTVLTYAVALLVPALAFLLIYTLDQFKTANNRTILLCALWGALVFPLAGLLNSQLRLLLGDEAVVRLAAPLIEEILKALVLVYLIRQPSFRYFVDGAVYGFGVGIGFAMVENLAYLGGEPSLALAVTRVLSTSLMHALASGVVGVSLGRLRRSEMRLLPLLGIGSAVLIHIGYNNAVLSLTGGGLLLAAAIVGIGGALAIALQILYGLRGEKARFTQALSQQTDISAGERQAIQQLGGASIEAILHELRCTFGEENVGLIRRLLVTEANIGILRNNLNACNVSARLRKAWEAEIAERQAESQRLRQQMGTSVFAYMSSLFPSHDETTWAYLQEQFARHDPTMVHTFDMFMRMTELAKRFTPTQLEAMAQRLSRIDIFRQISLADLENLSRAVEFAEFTDGEMLFDKGDEGDAMYLIETGAIKIYALDHGQREKYLRTYSTGQVVGDFSVLDGEKRSARARVHGNLAVMVLRRTVFQMFIQSRPQVILAVLVVLAERGRYTTRAVETSIQTLSGIARGDYTCALPQTSSLSGEPVASEVPGNLTSLVEHSLAQYAALLQVREEATG